MVSLCFLSHNQIMFNFCKRVFFFYPFLGFSHHSSSSTDHDHRLDELHRPENCRSAGGLSLLVGDGERNDHRPNVLESLSVKRPKSVVSEKKKENSGFCSFLDEKKNHGMGMSSCTESLGFESSDQMEEDDEDREVGVVEEEELRVRLSWRRRLLLERVKHRDEMMKNQNKKFPPPLSSLNQNGKPNFIFKHVRKDGRLELTEVSVDPPNEILRAERQDGRLRLHLMVPAATKIEHDEVEEMMIEHDEVEESEIQEMKFPLIGEGIRRCQEIGNRRNHYHHHHHHHHHMPIWKQHGVTTRSTVHVL